MKFETWFGLGFGVFAVLRVWLGVLEYRAWKALLMTEPLAVTMLRAYANRPRIIKP